MTRTFTLTATTLKNGKTLYQVIDNNGEVVAKRTSTRKYVACTANGECFFGRVDLIGKGEHASYLTTIDNYKNHSTREDYERMLANKKVEIHKCNVMHLSTFKRFSTEEHLNAPLKEWEYNHLVEFYGKEVADSVHTEWEFQVATCNDEYEYEHFLAIVGDYEQWSSKRFEYAEKVEEGFSNIAYLA